jgi:hypothetical protein
MAVLFKWGKWELAPPGLGQAGKGRRESEVARDRQGQAPRSLQPLMLMR